MLQKISCVFISLLIILFSCLTVSAVGQEQEQSTSIVYVATPDSVQSVQSIQELNAKLDYQNMLITSAFVIACAVAVILILYKFIRQFY